MKELLEKSEFTIVKIGNFLEQFKLLSDSHRTDKMKKLELNINNQVAAIEAEYLAVINRESEQLVELYQARSDDARSIDSKAMMADFSALVEQAKNECLKSAKRIWFTHLMTTHRANQLIRNSVNVPTPIDKLDKIFQTAQIQSQLTFDPEEIEKLQGIWRKEFGPPARVTDKIVSFTKREFHERKNKQMDEMERARSAIKSLAEN